MVCKNKIFFYIMIINWSKNKAKNHSFSNDSKNDSRLSNEETKISPNDTPQESINQNSFLSNDDSVIADFVKNDESVSDSSLFLFSVMKPNEQAPSLESQFECNISMLKTASSQNEIIIKKLIDDMTSNSSNFKFIMFAAEQIAKNMTDIVINNQNGYLLVLHILSLTTQKKEKTELITQIFNNTINFLNNNNGVTLLIELCKTKNICFINTMLYYILNNFAYYCTNNFSSQLICSLYQLNLDFLTFQMNKWLSANFENIASNTYGKQVIFHAIKYSEPKAKIFLEKQYSNFFFENNSVF